MVCATPRSEKGLDVPQMKAVDLFAGAGGSSTGMALAGWDVVWAANHWPDAVRVHELNHPATRHVVQDLHQADFRELPDYDVLWASPSCTGHSTAASGGGRYARRGGHPLHDWLRSTAWAAVTAAEVTRPVACVIENVEELRSWCLWEPWLAAWKALGYALHVHTLNASDFGVPQDRPRLFVVAVRGSTPLVLDQPAPGSPAMRPVFDLAAGSWSRLPDCAAGVRTRVQRAIARHDYPDAFHTQSVTDNSGRSLDRPAPVVTTKHQHGLVRGTGPWQKREYRPLHLVEYQRLMGFPDTYNLGDVGVCKGCKLLGNAVCPPVAKWICRQLETRL